MLLLFFLSGLDLPQSITHGIGPLDAGKVLTLVEAVRNARTHLNTAATSGRSGRKSSADSVGAEAIQDFCRAYAEDARQYQYYKQVSHQCLSFPIGATLS